MLFALCATLIALVLLRLFGGAIAARIICAIAFAGVALLVAAYCVDPALAKDYVVHFDGFHLAREANFGGDMTTVVHVPTGTLVTSFFSAMQPIFLSLASAALMAALGLLGPQWQKAAKAAHADLLLDRAINNGIALVEGATNGKVLNIDVGNKVIAQACQIIVDEAPWLFKELGSRLGPAIAGKLAARDMLPDNASAKTLNLQPIAAPLVPANPPRAAT